MSQPVPISAIRVERNDRTLFNEDEMAELAASIAGVGLIQPILVRPDGDGYLLVAGERRLRAHKLLGRETIEANVEAFDDETAAVAMFVENVQRSDLNPIDEANAYADRLTRFGGTIEELAGQLGVAAFRIRWRLDLLKLCPDAEALVRCGQLAVGFARSMARLDHNRQVIALRSLQRSPNMSHTDFVILCESLLGDQCQESLLPDDVLRNEQWGQRPARTRKVSRRELQGALEAVLDVLDGTSIEDPRIDRARELAQIGA